MPIRVFIVDQQAVVRAGLSLAFTANCEVDVVGESPTLAIGFDRIIAAQPDVLIVDTLSEQMAQIDLVRQLSLLLPTTRVLLFTDQDSPQIAESIVRLGAQGYLTKNASLDDVLTGVRALHAGRVFISHSSAPVPKRHLDRDRKPQSTIAPLDLSERETEVVLLLAEGLTNKEVAQRLFISTKTVETYRSRVSKKHQLQGRAQLFEFSRRIEQRNNAASL